jgi:hypothetical protein
MGLQVGRNDVMVIEELITALRPLAELYWLIDDQSHLPDDTEFFRHDGSYITYGDIRRAASLIGLEE